MDLLAQPCGSRATCLVAGQLIAMIMNELLTPAGCSKHCPGHSGNASPVSECAPHSTFVCTPGSGWQSISPVVRRCSAIPRFTNNKKASRNRSLEAFVIPNGRCERIRTFDPLHPMQVRYQAAPHTENESIRGERQWVALSRSRISNNSRRTS